jgi:hypothetical protein
MLVDKENLAPNVQAPATNKRTFGTPIKSPLKSGCARLIPAGVRPDSEVRTLSSVGKLQVLDLGCCRQVSEKTTIVQHGADNEQLQLASSLAWIIVRKTIWVADLIPSCVARTSTVQFLGGIVVRYAEKVRISSMLLHRPCDNVLNLGRGLGCCKRWTRRCRRSSWTWRGGSFRNTVDYSRSRESRDLRCRASPDALKPPSVHHVQIADSGAGTLASMKDLRAELLEARQAPKRLNPSALVGLDYHPAPLLARTALRLAEVLIRSNYWTSGMHTMQRQLNCLNFARQVWPRDVPSR